jgi:alpha-glucoside transport system substrate-binding protein
LYEQAQGLVRAKQWQQALAKMEAIQPLAPDFGDPEGIAGTAREELAHEEEEARRQHELATLYAEAVHLLKAEHYQEALEKWREVQALDPRYPDRRRVQATARKKLVSLARPAARRRLPTWTIPAIGGLVFIALIVAGVLLGGELGGGAPTYLDRALAGEFEGTVVRVLGHWGVDEADKFKASAADFEDETGIDIHYQTSTDLDLDAEIANGMFDIVGFSIPSQLATYASQGQVVDVGTFLPQSSFDNYDQSWWDMATMEGPDGQDITAGVWHHFITKSLVWYPKDDFEAAGYEIPNTWEEMLALSDRIVTDGSTPWCIGIESDWATGWPATDWIEDILLRTTSLENYDRWVAGDLPFDSPEVRHAAKVMSEIWFNDDYVYGGRDYIVSAFYGESPNPMFEDPPKCWLHRQAYFITGHFPPGVEAGKDFDFFYLPPIDPTYGKPYLIAADIMAMFNDRDEVRAVMEYLTKGESTKGWLAAGGALAPHKDARLDWYGDQVERRIAQMSLGATSVRFDGSDLMPGQVGAGSFWKGMTDWVSGAADLDTVVKEIDAAWPR